MKRNVMLMLMWKVIQEVEYDYDRYMKPEDVDLLLTVMEKAGMLPPIEPGRTIYDLNLGIPEWEEE